VEEVGRLISQYKVREIFDDSGCFPKGEWLEEFCRGIIDKGYNKKVVLGCNMRVGALSDEQWRLMKQANFRFILIGLESVSQATLDRLNKGIKVDEIETTIGSCKKAGLQPHITAMVGYPWESRADAFATLKLAKMLMGKGWAVTLQSTIVIPYPGTKLYEEAVENEWFRVDPNDYERFDMTESILKTLDMEPEEVKKICDEIYKVFLSPNYVFRQLTRIRSLRDLKFSLRGAIKILGHVKDFARQ